MLSPFSLIICSYLVNIFCFYFNNSVTLSPLPQNEQECAYYLRTGQCKFGTTCKFHHPQLSNLASLHDSPVYPPVQSPTTPGQQSYSGGVTSWPLSRASIIQSPRWQAPSSYTPLIVPQGMVPGWNPYVVKFLHYI